MPLGATTLQTAKDMPRIYIKNILIVYTVFIHIYTNIHLKRSSIMEIIINNRKQLNNVYLLRVYAVRHFSLYHHQPGKENNV